MFIDYVKHDSLANVRKQHNIMVFIGNGFDIAVLNKYRNDKLVTSYSKFYDFLCYKGFNLANILFDKMTEDRRNNKANWSDFECSLGELIEDGIAAEELSQALIEIQNMFLLFLNEVVDTDILLKISEDAQGCKWGIDAVSKFLGDLSEEDYKKIHFPQGMYHYEMYNYLFVNFNYTSLFDNYIYLDKEQFDPHCYKYVDTNFQFHPNPNGYENLGTNNETKWSSNVMTNTIHPHGYQNIPRSLLFGIEDERYKTNRELNGFNKSYWAQNNQKYQTYFDDAELFIIYGTSIGETDSWWWKNIYKSLSTKDTELIIYYYDANKNCNKEYVKQTFINACKVSATDEEIALVKEKIFVVLYDENSNNAMFGLKDKNTNLRQ